MVQSLHMASKLNTVPTCTATHTRRTKHIVCSSSVAVPTSYWGQPSAQHAVFSATPCPDTASLSTLVTTTQHSCHVAATGDCNNRPAQPMPYVLKSNIDEKTVKLSHNVTCRHNKHTCIRPVAKAAKPHPAKATTRSQIRTLPNNSLTAFTRQGSLPRRNWHVASKTAAIIGQQIHQQQNSSNSRPNVRAPSKPHFLAAQAKP
jgi:hypothetical protein